MAKGARARADVKFWRRWKLDGQLTGFCVALEAQHDLRGAVPSRRNILGHVPGVLFRVDGETSREAKVANLELTVGVDQKISGLQVTMQHVGRVDVLQAAKCLVDERLEVRVGEGLLRADLRGGTEGEWSKRRWRREYARLRADLPP